jgi:hypothetical protein
MTLNARLALSDLLVDIERELQPPEKSPGDYPMSLPAAIELLGDTCDTLRRVLKTLPESQRPNAYLPARHPRALRPLSQDEV